MKKFLLCSILLVSILGENKSTNQKIKNINFAIIRDIGIEEARTEEEKLYQFSVIYSIDCDKEGNIYVLDGKESCVKIFEKNGKFIKKLFREGKGPQEISNAYQVKINKFNGHIYVLHEHGFHLKEFNSLGIYLKSYPMPEQFFNYFDFMDEGRIIFVAKERPREKGYNNFKILNLKTLKIEKEFAITDRPSVINGYMRFVIEDKTLWTCPGDEMRLVVYDLDSGKEIKSIGIKEKYRKFKILRGPNWIRSVLYNYAQPFLVNNKLYVLLTKIEYFKDETIEDVHTPKSQKLFLYSFERDSLIKLKEIPEGAFMWLETVWENRLILYKLEPYPLIRILEIKIK